MKTATLSGAGGGGYTLMNGTFESNAALTPLNTPLAQGAAVGDGWTVKELISSIFTPILETGAAHLGTQSLLIRIPVSQTIAAHAYASCRVFSSSVVVTPGVPITYSCYKGWWSSGASMAGLTILQRLGVFFYDQFGNFLSEDYIDTNNTVTNSSGNQVVVAPSHAIQFRVDG